MDRHMVADTRCSQNKPDSLHRVGRLADHDRVDTTVVAVVVVVSMPVQGTVVVQVYTLPGLVVVDRACKQVGRAVHPPDRQVAHLLHVPGKKTPQMLAVVVVYPFPALKEI